jgi:hypothetical protein
MKTSVFDFLTDISLTKKDILNEENESEYSPYIINRFLSMDATTVMYANDMNLHANLSKRMQYDYYLHGIKKQKRFFKYLKTQKEKNIDLIKEYFGYSERQAKDVLCVLTKDDLDYIETRLQKGGVDGKAKK